MSEKIATRQAYGEKLLELGGKYSDLVVLDADLSGSTNTNKFANAYPERFFNMGSAEQNMISTAAGLALAGKIPFSSSLDNYPNLFRQGLTIDACQRVS